MLGPTKEMFDIMPTMGNKTEVNQILNGQDAAFFWAIQHLAHSHRYQIFIFFFFKISKKVLSVLKVRFLFH